MFLPYRLIPCQSFLDKRIVSKTCELLFPSPTNGGTFCSPLLPVIILSGSGEVRTSTDIYTVVNSPRSHMLPSRNKTVSHQTVRTCKDIILVTLQSMRLKHLV